MKNRSYSYNRRRVVADDEINDVPAVNDAPETDSTQLLFEADDVAQLLAEVTQTPVDYDVDDQSGEVTFTVDEDTFTVSPEGDEEVLESANRRAMSGRRPVAASRRTALTRRPAARRPVSASTRPSASRVTRKYPTSKR